MVVVEEINIFCRVVLPAALKNVAVDPGSTTSLGVNNFFIFLFFYFFLRGTGKM